jgi:sporulation protein YlmC with PRC-barrel domain
MKKLLLTLSLTFILALVLAGCSASEEDTTGAVDETGLQEEVPAAAVVETPPEEGSMPDTTTTEAVEEDDTTVEEPEAELSETPTTVAAESAQAGEMTAETEVIPPTGTVNLNRISNLLDFEVWNNNNEQIGSVNTIVINKETAQLEHVIVGSGGIFGLGETEIPVPWQVLDVHGTNHIAAEDSGESEEAMAATETPQNVFMVDITPVELEQVPEFDLTPLYEQPEMAGGEDQAMEANSLEDLELEIRSFWQNDLNQTEPADTVGEAATQTDQTTDQQSDQMVQASGPKQLILAEDLLDATLEDTGVGLSEQPAGDTPQDLTEADSMQALGTVEEIMVDPTSGKASYLLVSLNVLPPVGVEEPPVDSAPEAPAEGIEDSTLDGIPEPFTGDIQLATIDIVPIPLQAVEWNAEEGVLIYTGSESLEQAPTLSFDEIESGSSNWKSQADSFWGLEDEDIDN